MSSQYNYIPLTNLEKQGSQVDGCKISSPLLTELLENLPHEERHEILDFLPANKAFIDTFSHYHCKLYLPGCQRELSKMTPDKYDTETKVHRAFTKNIRLYKNNKSSLNVIFLWDLPNYMDKSILKELITYLSQHMHKTIKLHFYIHTKQQMPEMPSEYTISSDTKISVKNVSTTKAKSPLYFKEALQKILSPFKVKRTKLLSGGLQEYILEL